MKQELQISKAEITNVQSVLHSKEKVGLGVPVDMDFYTIFIFCFSISQYNIVCMRVW